MGRHEKTLEKIFEVPTRSDINWNDVESMLLHFGADITEGSGSRVRIALSGVRAVFHRPHPEKEVNYSIQIIDYGWSLPKQASELTRLSLKKGDFFKLR